MSSSFDVKKNQLAFQGKIHLICSDRELTILESQLSSVQVLGFDTETRPSFKKGQVFRVAILQLATDNDAFIIQLHSITQFERITRVLENENITKVGVAIRDDLRILKNAFPFEPKSFVELQDLAKCKGLKNFGLKGMTEEVLQGTLSKAAKMTNWEAPELTPRQLLYAATDAWIGLKLFQKLSE